MAHIVTSERLIGKFEPPSAGVNQLLPAHAIPTNALRDASNVIYRTGETIPRPGTAVFHSQVFTGTPTGIYQYVKGATEPIPVLGTTSRIYAYVSGAWADQTGSVQTATADQSARFTSLAIGTPLTSYVIHSNGKDTPSVWDGDGSLATFTNISGAPLFTDLCTIADHIIGIVPPYTVRWGNIHSYSDWPALNVKSASETSDQCIALVPLGQGSAAILYKERSLWYVSATGGATEATAFKFDPVGLFDGPASPAAVVNVNGAHIYMTNTGRIALFTGSNHSWVADGIWVKIRSDFDTSKAHRCWGFYDPTKYEVHFVYPSTALSGALRGYVGLALSTNGQGLNDTAAFPGTLTYALSAGGLIRLTDNIDRLIVAGGNASKSYSFSTSNTSDEGTGFSGFWRTGLATSPGSDIYRLEAVETFANRGTGYGQLTLTPIVSNTLANETGNDLLAVPVSLEAGSGEEAAKAPVGVDSRGRFFGLKFSFTDSTAVTLGYKGSMLYAQKKAG